MAFQSTNCEIRSNKILDVKRTPTVNAVAPIALEDTKVYLKMTGIDDDDTVIQDFIDEAINWLEEYCGVCILESDVTAIIELHNRQELPFGPVKTITIPECLTSDNCDFPNVYGYGKYTISYVSGYDPLPPALKGALYAYVAYAYEHRGDDLDETDTEFAGKAKKKAFPYIQNFGY